MCLQMVANLTDSSRIIRRPLKSQPEPTRKCEVSHVPIVNVIHRLYGTLIRYVTYVMREK